MEIFSLKGHDGHIIMTVKEIIGSTGYPLEGQCLDIICSLEIACSCYTAAAYEYCTSTADLYRFQKELQRCYEQLNGKAIYEKLWEDDLCFEVCMKEHGKAIITGAFRERPDKKSKLDFEIETDQSFLLPVICGIENFRRQLGEQNENK